MRGGTILQDGSDRTARPFEHLLSPVVTIDDGIIVVWRRCVQWMSLIAVFVGAGLGAVCRWLLGIALNPMFPTLPPGTLLVNVVGGCLMGVALGLLDQMQGLSPALRLAIMTGFLGGLTTFSAFSAETVTLLLRQQYGWASVIVLAHTFGSIVATLGGFALARYAIKA